VIEVEGREPNLLDAPRATWAGRQSLAVGWGEKAADRGLLIKARVAHVIASKLSERRGRIYEFNKTDESSCSR
jgi:hypothetical protein